jgi:hypothetical protein
MSAQQPALPAVVRVMSRRWPALLQCVCVFLDSPVFLRFLELRQCLNRAMGLGITTLLVWLGGGGWFYR